MGGGFNARNEILDITADAMTDSVIEKIKLV